MAGGWQLFEIWVIAFFTLALFSFMYKDNPFYKIAEHIFAGLSAGYYVGLIWDTVIVQQLWDPMIGGKWLLIIPGILGFMMFARFTRNHTWIARSSLAFVMGVTSGIFLTSQLHGLVLPQMRATMSPATTKLASVSSDYWADPAGRLVVVTGDETAASPDTLTAAVDSTVADLALIDSSKTGTSAEPEMLPEEIEGDGIVLNLRSIAVEPSHMVLGDDSVIAVLASFKDTSDKSLGDFYSATVKIKGDSTEFTVANNVWDGWNGMKVSEVSPGQFQMRYEFESAQIEEAGQYSVKVEIHRNERLFLLTLIVVLGVISTLIYFYFSKEHTGALGVTAKVGIWFIMISFGAHFGYTVMGRVSLLIGRVQFLIEDWVGSFHQLF